ncbi:xanthine dehydrogenase family protein molybdopterin-binding subunit [Chloroflexota bacterium]
MQTEMSVVGKRIPLREGYTKVTGREKFVPDMSMPGALWMKLKRSPYARALIKSIDTARAAALPGVGAVITYNDVPQKELRCIITNWRGRLLDDNLRFVGDEVAAVAAETPEIAERALDLIEVEYEQLTPVFDIEEALKPDAPDVRREGSNRVSCPPEPGSSPSIQVWGDVDKAFAEADVIVEHEVRTNRIYGSFFPGACIAQWESGRLTITLSHQTPFNIQRSTAAVFDMPENQVRIICPLMACTNGMFNNSQRFYNLAAILSRKTGRPVIYKMTIEEFGIYKSREADIMRTKMGGKKDGTVTALDYAQLHDNGGYCWKCTTYSGNHDIFRKAGVKYEAYGVCTNKFSTGCIRGPGNTPQSLAMNQTFDMLLEELGLDPVPAWKENHLRKGDLVKPARIKNLPLSSDGYDEIIESGAKAIGWREKWRGWGKPYQVAGSRRRGVGIALAHQSGGAPRFPAAARVQINHDGTAHVLAGTTELGTGSKTAYAQIGAEALGFKIGDVYAAKEVDTETWPWACMTGGSISLFLEGLCVQVAADDARQQILEMAATAPWSPDVLKEGVKGAESLDIKDSMIYVKADPGRCAAVKDVVGSVLAPIVIGRARRHGVAIPGPTPQACVGGFADVEVDTGTGRITVLKLVMGQDNGRIINPDTAENQVYGGGLMSCGYALMEEVVFDPATGKALNPALTDYRVPTVLDLPPIQPIFTSSIDPLGPFGGKGMGESTTVYPHSVIASAVYNAIGVRIRELPLTPEKVLRALGKAR